MYYKVGETGIQETDRMHWEQTFGGIAVFDEDEWGEELKLQEAYSLGKKEEDSFFCKLEAHASYLFGTFHIPVKKRERRNFDFAAYILKDRLIFIEEGSFVEECICRVRNQAAQKPYSLEQFISDFFMALLEEDILYLAVLERDIANMEEAVLEGNTTHFHYRMLGMKKEISRFYCYYGQMTDVAETLVARRNVGEDLLERVKRLQSEAQSLREYAMQVQDVYQAEITIQQNNVMNLLTVVTTVFLPLTLIAGWYGMNFYNMPELEWKYGYLVVSCVCVGIIVLVLWFFKKKRFF
ncbi:MAG: magnesium and cobalt transporter CorA [Eubacterium sp.]|nr:magnesium and cobalt transporter CorA [Eubacterium sp.]